VHVSEPLSPAAAGVAEHGSDWDRAIALRGLVREQMLRHCGEPDLADRRELSW
jgi:hypothetical protein